MRGENDSTTHLGVMRKNNSPRKLTSKTHDMLAMYKRNDRRYSVLPIKKIRNSVDTACKGG